MNASANDSTDIYSLRWYFRYPVAAVILAVGVWLTYAMLEAGKNGWLAYGLGGVAVFFGATIAWELSLVLLGIGVIWWVTTWSKESQVVLGVVCFSAYVGHLWDKSTAVTNKKIDNLQRQIDELRHGRY